MTFIKLLALPILLSPTMLGMKETNPSTSSTLFSSVCFVTNSSFDDIKTNSISLAKPEQVSSNHSFSYEAYAFDEDELRTNPELATLASEIYSSSKLVYLCGSDVSTDDFSDLISHEPYVFSGSDGLSNDVDLTSPKEYLVSTEEENPANVISGINDPVSPYKPSLVFFGENPIFEDYCNLVANDFVMQFENREINLASDLTEIDTSKGYVYSYVPGTTNAYLMASWTLWQNMEERVPDQYFYGLTSEITAGVSVLFDLTRVNAYYQISNTSDVVINDVAPKNKNNLSLSVSGSAGTSGVNVSLGTALSCDPIYNYYADREHGEVEFQWDKDLTRLNTDWFSSGVSWHCPSYRPSAIYKFWGTYLGLVPSTPGSVRISAMAY